MVLGIVPFGGPLGTIPELLFLNKGTHKPLVIGLNPVAATFVYILFSFKPALDNNESNCIEIRQAQGYHMG